MGWMGKVLRVNLATGDCAGEPLNREWAEAYLGQRGLGTKYLSAEIDASVDPLDPANKLIMITGPLTGTMSPTGGRYSVVTKGALTGAIACSNSGGKFGAELKNAGWDMIIFEGRAPSPVYLLVEDDVAQLLPADDLWGRSVWQVEPELIARHGIPEVRVASIGRAGEIGVLYAAIINDMDRAAGRSGVGAVMGSKNLKAVALRGSSGVSVADPKAFMAAVKTARAKLDPSTARQRLGEVGTHAMLDVMQAFGGLPTRNNQAVEFEGTNKINAAASKTPRASDGKSILLKNRACYACTIACARVLKIDPSHFSVADKPEYQGISGGLEFENIYALGAMVGIDDIDAATFANFVCNEHGMDTISFGGTLASAMELYETGAISDADTGGIALRFGSAEALVEMVRLTAHGEGFGKELGLGGRRLCDKYGHPEFFMGVKSQEFAGYDGRAMPGMALGYATSNRGACHLRAAPLPSDFATQELEGKAEMVKRTQDERCAGYDCTGLCVFTGGVFSLDDVAAMIGGACGGTWTADRLREVGERTNNLERTFNLEAGFSRADDTLPDRILKTPAPSGTGEGKVARLDILMPQYYEERGWDEDGVPRLQTLRRLGIA